MEKWCEIRQRVLRDGVSIRQIQRETGLHFETIKKVLAHSIPPQFQAPIREKPKIGPYLERIAEILHSDRQRPRKQRHTAKRIFQRLREEGYRGGYTQVKGQSGSSNRAVEKSSFPWSMSRERPRLTSVSPW